MLEGMLRFPSNTHPLYVGTLKGLGLELAGADFCACSPSWFTWWGPAFQDRSGLGTGWNAAANGTSLYRPFALFLSGLQGCSNCSHLPSPSTLLTPAHLFLGGLLADRSREGARSAATCHCKNTVNIPCFVLDMQQQYHVILGDTMAPGN
eukprot:1155829-Pelagomonas_calceolata.AAC.1